MNFIKRLSAQYRMGTKIQFNIKMDNYTYYYRNKNVWLNDLESDYHDMYRHLKYLNTEDNYEIFQKEI